jgi:hypothetical protein
MFGPVHKLTRALEFGTNYCWDVQIAPCCGRARPSREPEWIEWQPPEGDRLEREPVACCPDPDVRLTMRADRIGPRSLQTAALT